MMDINTNYEIYAQILMDILLREVGQERFNKLILEINRRLENYNNQIGREKNGRKHTI